MDFVLFDDARREHLLPLTFIRPVSELRVGITTIREKWERYGQCKGWLTEAYLAKKYPLPERDPGLYINSGILPDNALATAISELEPGKALVKDGELIAVRTNMVTGSRAEMLEHLHGQKPIAYQGEFLSVSRCWHLFQYNDAALRDDYARLSGNASSQKPSGSNTIMGNALFMEDGAKMEACTVNTDNGPVYIGKDAEIMEGCLIRGPVAICAHATLKMGARLYGGTTIGPWCKAGGEISNSILSEYANKAHDGFLGNSYIGSWCNIGADTNNSNLKNNYTEVKLWDYAMQKFSPTGLQFCGLIMGDHGKCGINTMFNTGTVTGFSVNIYGAGFPKNFIPSFSWGGPSGYVTYKLEKAIQVAEIMMQRRGIELTETDKDLFASVYALSERYRKGELIFLHRRQGSPGMP